MYILTRHGDPQPEFTPRLQARHRRTLFEESAIDPQVAAERGIETITWGRDLPKTYSRRQKQRAPGVLFTVHRPGGETATIFRPDEPRPDKPGHRYEQECKHLGGCGNVLDVHPSIRPKIDDASVPVVFVEGTKKGDAMVSAARKAGTDLLIVAISGVWNFISDGEPIPDMFDIPVKGRRTLIAFDSDMVRKPEVQGAAETLAQHLTQRGADLEIVYLPDQEDGSKNGADDFLAGGGTLDELLELARPYAPGDLQSEKLRRNEGLEASLGYLVSLLDELPTTTTGECTMPSIWRACVAILEKRGKLRAGGIETILPSLYGAEVAHVSQPTFSKRMTELEEAGLVRRIRPEKREEADVYVFGVPGGVTRYNSGAEGGESSKSYIGVYRGYKRLHPLPEVRWSTPGSRKKKRGVVSGTRKPRQGASSGEAEPKRRPGKKRDEVLRYVSAGSGTASREELLERFGTSKTSWKDFKRNVLSELLGVRRRYRGTPLSVGPPVLELTDDGVRLVPDWEDAWAKHRVLSEEKEAETKQARDHVMRRIAYRRRKETPADRAPTDEELAAGREGRHKRLRIEGLVAEGLARHIAVEEVMGVDPETGEVVDEYREVPVGLADEHPLSCECQDCSARSPSYARTGP